MRRGDCLALMLGALLTLGFAPRAQALDIDLRTNAGFTVFGADDFDATGRAVAMADLDGDGFRDIIIGSIGTTVPATSSPNSGSVDIIWGDTQANLGLTRDLLISSRRAHRRRRHRRPGGAFSSLPAISTRMAARTSRSARRWVTGPGNIARTAATSTSSTAARARRGPASRR
jgi:hypothetical protein